MFRTKSGSESPNIRRQFLKAKKASNQSGPLNHSLEVYNHHKLVFYSDGHWLYPLFDLEDFVQRSSFAARDLLIKDKIVGRAASLLMVHLGATLVYADMLSKLGEEVFQKYNITYEYRMLVKKIGCQTEELLKEVLDPEEGYQLIKNRIRRNSESGGHFTAMNK
jgi:hypothetical protein